MIGQHSPTSQAAPGQRFQYQVPPKSPALSMIRKSLIPALVSSAPRHNPPNPPPKTKKSVSMSSGSRSTRVVYGSVRQCWNCPLNCLYWAFPSFLSRLSRSARYLSLIFAGSNGSVAASYKGVSIEFQKTTREGLPMHKMLLYTGDSRKKAFYRKY